MERVTGKLVSPNDTRHFDITKEEEKNIYHLRVSHRNQGAIAVDAPEWSVVSYTPMNMAGIRNRLEWLVDRGYEIKFITGRIRGVKLNLQVKIPEKKGFSKVIQKGRATA